MAIRIKHRHYHYGNSQDTADALLRIERQQQEFYSQLKQQIQMSTDAQLQRLAALEEQVAKVYTEVTTVNQENANTIAQLRAELEAKGALDESVNEKLSSLEAGVNKLDELKEDAAPEEGGDDSEG